MLTPRQEQVFNFIDSYIKKHGRSPSLIVISKKLKIKSSCSVWQFINILVKKGYLEKEYKQKNSLRVRNEKNTSEWHAGYQAGTKHMIAELINRGVLKRSQLPFDLKQYAGS